MQLSEYLSTEQLKTLKVPRYKRILKKYDDFILCVNIGDAEYIATEHPNLVYTLYLYVNKGKGKIGKIEGDKIEWEDLNSNKEKLVDVSKYITSYGIMIAETDFYYIGFNTLDKNIKWDGKLIKETDSPVIVNDANSYFVCLDGKVIINHKEFKRFDYASVDAGKEYTVDLTETGVLGLFTKLN